MPFDSSSVISQKVGSSKLRTYFIGFDLGKYRDEPFIEILLDTVVDFAFGYHTGILKSYNRRILKEAAKSIYKIKAFSEVKWVYVDEDSEISDCELTIEKKYLKRGEFGEMILHLLLRDFFETVPLLAKFHFKDTDSSTVHGFDVVHVGKDLSDPSKESLYLGESKLYARKDGKSGQHGVDDLIKDIKDHFHTDFLYREIALISKKRDAFKTLDDYEDQNTKDEYQSYLAKKSHWFDVLENVVRGKSKLQDFFKSVTIPVVCTYQSKIFEDCTDENSDKFKSELEEETSHLYELFQRKLGAIEVEKGQPVRTDLNIILILFPIPSKRSLLKVLHEKLFNLQN